MKALRRKGKQRGIHGASGSTMKAIIAMKAARGYGAVIYVVKKKLSR